MDGIDRIMLTGYCKGELQTIAEQAGAPVELGPRDLRDLPEHFGKKALTEYGGYDLEIIAEINHAPQFSRERILHQARHFRESGADVIDIGCNTGETWAGVADAVRMLRDEGMRVSIDSFNAPEVEAAIKAGAELVLSVNTANLDAALDWGCEVVAVPDVPASLEGLDLVIERLSAANVRFRIDPIIEPIAFGFAASLGRYLEVRRRYPNTEIMMGVGNLTELTDVDSVGVNVLLAGFCQEIGIRSVLTTEVINWARSSVREFDLARRLMFHAVRNRVLPKHVEPKLVMLRDPKQCEQGEAALNDLARRISDPNFRIFAERDLLHVLNNRMFLSGPNPFDLFEQMLKTEKIDSAHAFYLGYEMAKAATALTLGKNYMQDQPLQWGFLTKPEQAHRIKTASDEKPTSPPTP
jgi:dihydropteroate synthase-like protein